MSDIIPAHPLVPLTKTEITAVAEAVKSHPNYPQSGSVAQSNKPVFARIQLVEPPKYDVMNYDLGESVNIIRKAESQVYEPIKAKTHIFITQIKYVNGALLTTVESHKRIRAIPAMDQYIYDPYTEFPVWEGGRPDGYTGPVISEQILANSELMEILSKRLYPNDPAALQKSQADLESGRVRADYIGGFESFRETNDCTDCCNELVGKCEPWKRYSTVYFRFFPGSQVFNDSISKQTPVFAAGGDESGEGPGNGYYGSLARLEGLVVRINVTDKKIMEYVDLGLEIAPDVVEDKIQRPKHGWRTEVQPMVVDTPVGSSYTYDETTGLIQLDNWQMRLSWDYQNGVQLYGVKYSDTNIETGDEEVRSVLYKLGVTEDTVSYSVGNPMFRRNFTSADASFYPVLRRLIKLEKGVHTPPTATLVSIPLSDKDGTFTEGEPNVDLVDRVAIYEQDGDLTNIYTGATGPASRGRELVVRSIFSGLFYLWVFDYIFRQDGTIECKVEVTGRLVVALRNGQPSSPWAEYVAKNYAGLIHNHIYTYRMDFNIDYEHATCNRFSNEVEIEEAVPANNDRETKCNVNILTENDCSRKNKRNKRHDKNDCGCTDCLEVLNPCGHGVLSKHTHVHTEKDSISNVNALTNRTWAIKQKYSNLRLNNGSPENKPIHRGYALMPAFNGATAAQYWSWLTTHFGFVKSNFLATKYHQKEQYASGKFPILQNKDVGIWGRVQRKNKIIHDEDIVVWYTMPFNHTCHTEDFPYITLAPQSFTLIPHNFFEWNPASTIIPNRLYSYDDVEHQ